MEPNAVFEGMDLTAIERSKREMFACSILGDNAALEELLRKDPGLADCMWGYFTPLHFAVRLRHADTVKLLLAHRADATARTLGWQDDPLTKARDRGYEEIADLLERHLARNYQVSPAGSAIARLIREGRNDDVLRKLEDDPELIHAGDERGNTPLHWAVLTRQIALIDELLRRGADIQAQRADGATPALLAVHGDYWYRANRDLGRKALRNPWFLLGYLIARGAAYDIWTAAAVGDAECVAALLQENPSLVNMRNSVDRRPVGYAAKYGHAATVRLLLESGADPNAEERDAPGGSALWAAAAGGHEDCARMLLEHGADPNATVEAGGTPLYIAASNKYDALVKLLYAHGASIQLESACCLGRIDLAGEMIHANPALVNSGGDFGPLCLAAGYGHADIVGLLIRRGADLNAPWYANNYIGYAADYSLDMVRLLLEAGADPNNANWLGVTYLHKAAYQGNMELAELLLQFGARLHAVDKEYGTTPLGWAAKYGKTDMARFLLDKGADPRLPAEEPWTQPLAWAKRRGHTDIVAMLTEWGFSAGDENNASGQSFVE